MGCRQWYRLGTESKAPAGFSQGTISNRTESSQVKSALNGELRHGVRGGRLPPNVTATGDTASVCEYRGNLIFLASFTRAVGTQPRPPAWRPKLGSHSISHTTVTPSSASIAAGSMSGMESMAARLEHAMRPSSDETRISVKP